MARSELKKRVEALEVRTRSRHRGAYAWTVREAEETLDDARSRYERAEGGLNGRALLIWQPAVEVAAP